MSIDETLLTLALELMADWDSTVDTSTGSSFRTQVLDPLLTRAGGSPLDVDLEAFLVERLEAEIADVDVTPFSAMRDLVIRAFIAMSEPFQREINGVKLAQSLNNWQVITRDELNALLGNYFTELQEGELARGVVRNYFPAPQSVTVGVSTQYSTGGGLNFFPLVVQQISDVQMSFQVEGELYYFDVLVQAEAAGEAYNVEVEEINATVGVSGVLRVANRSKFTTGLAEETKEEAVARTQNSITVRNLITERGVAFVIPENFPVIDLLQTIGYGDVEMLRDVVKGPTEISDIPGGISGKSDPDLTGGQQIHIGGMTDVYAYQETPDEDDLDIEDLTDKGQRVFAGNHGFTQSTPVLTGLFEDLYGFFTKRGVTAGDILLLGEVEYLIGAGTTDTTLTVTPVTIPAGLFDQVYDIVRRTTGQVTVPLYDLVAIDSDGVVELTASGLPAAPIPGSATNAVLLDSLGAAVAKIDNVTTENVLLPLLRVESVGFLDPLTKEPLGQVVPMRDLMLVLAQTGFDTATPLAGTVRLYFRDAVNCWVRWSSPITSFSNPSDISYNPIEQVNETGIASVVDLTSEEVLLDDTGTVTDGDYTGLIALGDRIEVNGEVLMVVGTSYNGSDTTTLTVREDLTTHFGSIFSGADLESHAGILEANMSQDAVTGMYFVDFEVVTVTPSSGMALGTVLTALFVNVEGWTLKTTYSTLSYSTRELPYLQVSTWVNDTTQLGITFTAPAIRVAYEYASTLTAVQEFADAPENRIVAEDVLIRHFVTSYIRGSFTIGDLDAATGKETIIDYINALDPTDDLEVSDVLNSLYAAGTTHVVLPLTLTKLTQNRDRTWDGLFDQDTLGSSRIQHFIADQDFIVVTEES